ncbi:MAG TPA: hypothetical protein VD763_08075 [Candidatus Saccharimonadales bacterium]|nr:hypothetical protein [Candidatus Saccharimonadales bacterium]
MSKRRTITLLVLAAGLVLGLPAAASAAGPVIERGRTTDTFADEFILDLCGIETMTTVTDHWMLKTYPDGSEVFHVTRRFESEDPRLPIEFGAATNFISPDGVETVVGTPIHLVRPGEGTILIDAGWITLGDPEVFRGPHPSRGVDLAAYYCP